MFDLGAGELLIIVIVAVIVIGPKDIPLAMRTAGRWIGKIRRISGHFRAGIDTMIREAEMEPTGALPSPAPTAAPPPPAPEASAEARIEPPAEPIEAEEPQLPFGKRK